MNRNEMKIPEGAENGLLLDFPREHKPEKSMKSEPNEGNSDLQQLEQALRQSMMLSSEESEARRNVPARSYTSYIVLRTFVSSLIGQMFL